MLMEKQQQQVFRKKPDILIGQCFLRLGSDGKPAQAGTIKCKTLDGKYIVEVTFGGDRYGRLVTTDDMVREDWRLFQSAAMWQRAFKAATNQ